MQLFISSALTHRRSGFFTELRSIVAWALAVWLTFGVAATAQDKPPSTEKPKAEPSAPVKKPSPSIDAKPKTPSSQDPVDRLLARRSDPVDALLQAIEQTVWKDETTRRRLLKKVGELDKPGNLIVAVGRAALKTKDREALAVLLEAWAGGRVSEEARSELLGLVLEPFHQERSIFDLIFSAARRHGTSKGDLERLIGLVPPCLSAMRFQAQRTIDQDRWAAVCGIIELWNELDAPARESTLRGVMEPVLTRITGGLDLEGRAAWSGWMKRLAKIDAARPRESLSLADILRDALRESAKRLEAERLRHRRDVTRLIALLAQHGVPAIAMLLNEDAAIRDAVVVALESVNRGLSAKDRAAAVQELIAQLGDASQPIEVYGSLLDASAVLGRDLSPELSKSLVEAVFQRNCAARPDLLDRQVLVLGRIGARSEGVRLAKIFTAAGSDAAEASPAWVQVRRDVVRVLGVLGTGVETILRALKDPSSVVRGEAALVLKGFSNQFGQPQGISTDVFVAALKNEKDPSVRLRLLESIQAFVEARPDLATQDLLEQVNAPRGPAEAMDRRVRIWVQLALSPKTPEEVRVAARERVRQALLEKGPGETCARVLMATAGEDAALMLGEALAQAPWSAELRNEVHAHLAKSLAPEKLWQLAVAMGLLNMESPPSSAAALANAALTVASDPNVDSAWMRAALEQCRASTSPWAAPWGLRLLDRLAVRDPSGLDVDALRLAFFWNQWSAGLLSNEGVKAMAGLFERILARKGVDPKRRAQDLRRWLRFSAARGDFPSVREALRRLVEANVATNLERLKDELARALSSREEAAKVAGGFPPGQTPPEGESGTLWRLTRAVAVYLAPLPDRDGDVGQDLKGPGADGLVDRFRAAAKARAWWAARLAASGGTDESWNGAPDDLLRGALMLLEQGGVKPEDGPRFASWLAKAFPQLNSKQPVAWPADSNGAAADAVRETLLKWWRSLPVSPEFQAAFLKVM